MSTNLIPFNDHVLVRANLPETKTQTGLLIPEIATKDNPEAVVVAITSGYYHSSGNFVPSRLRPGMKVLLRPGTGFGIIFDREKLIMVKEHDVLGIIS